MCVGEGGWLSSYCGGQEEGGGGAGLDGGRRGCMTFVSMATVSLSLSLLLSRSDVRALVCCCILAPV